MFSPLFYGWRSWKHAKNIALLASVALAVGIGSATAIYTVIHAVLLNPLGYANPDRYLSVMGAWRNIPGGYSAFSYPNYVDFAARQRTLDAFGCATTPHFEEGNFNVTLGGHSIHADGTEVTPALVRSFGVKPILGRWFEDDRKDPASLHTTVISESLWRRSGFKPNIIGQVLSMNGVPYTVVGVAPGWFRFPLESPLNEVWVRFHSIRALGSVRSATLTIWSVTPR